ncbi:hypothetical protein [Rhodopirellula europaea]|uniref:Uncharacterized protein n=1 Tax=Rhodopirellula europaea SH398 TaxID=1263868 RepID=M5SHA2_9BACT|nr:hypothetical protein [Rhodopirellula europaea]EMI25579.1 hypothetical protein RESH_03792 [Rhodopirellula europaea SH398]
MSEYQWIEFLAIESPLDSDAIEFMQAQSSRAEVDRWRFTNEYNFGSFRGDWREMLRRGYDLHVHYSNFGNRSLCMRFPDGFEFSEQVDDYTDGEQIWWEGDETGTGGLLVIEPEGDAGTFEPIWEAESLASDFVALWHMILRGDMRPLYLAYLGLCCWDIVDRNGENGESEAYSGDEEPPVPPGLKQSHPSLDRLGNTLKSTVFCWRLRRKDQRKCKTHRLARSTSTNGLSLAASRSWVKR